MLITKPERQKWMKDAIQSFVSQLSSKYPTTAGATPMALSPHCSIVSLDRLKNFDDNVDWIPEIHITVVRVPKGEEGAEIVLEEIT